MKSKLLSVLIISCVVAATGCRMCCAPYDYEYGAYGGNLDRGDRLHGRVGSAFSPAEAVVNRGPQMGEPPIESAKRELTGDTHFE